MHVSVFGEVVIGLSAGQSNGIAACGGLCLFGKSVTFTYAASFTPNIEHRSFWNGRVRTSSRAGDARIVAPATTRED